MSADARKRFGSIEGLFTAAEAVRDLMRQPGWAVLMAIVDDEVGKLDHRLDDPQEPLERAKYAMLHGRRGGLKALELAAHAVVQAGDAEMQRQRERHEGAAEPALEGIT